MSIWNLEIDIDYTEFFFLNEEDKNSFHKLTQDYFEKSILISQEWRTLYMQRGIPKKNTDFFEIDNSGIFAASQNAFNVLSNFFDEKVEALLIETDSGKFYALNVINVIDCIDSKTSKYNSTVNGQIVSYSLIDFDLEKLGESQIFKVPQMPYHIFISDEIYEVYETKNLRGLSFDSELNLVWYPE